MSGLHASIASHIVMDTDDLNIFNTRIGHYPERIKNIYFTFLFLLRAVTKAAPLITKYNYNTGNIDEDNQLRALLQQLLSDTLLCTPTFNESNMFQGQEKLSLKKQFKTKFLNISRMMDCVACEKCKVNGKLQILGLGTALKILFSNDIESLNLQRNEVVALVNTLRKFSDSIYTVQKLRAREKDNNKKLTIAIAVIIATILLSFVISICCKTPKKKDKQNSNSTLTKRNNKNNNKK